MRTNLRRVVGPDLPDHALEGLVRQGMRSYALYWYEVFRLPRTSSAVLLRRTVVHEEASFRRAEARGRGVVLALPHMGNWDHAGAWLTLSGTPFTTVAERLEPAALFTRFVAFREGLGMEVVPLTGGAEPPFDLLADRLRSGRVLCLLADRDLTAAGVPVTLFGATATMPAGPALLALRTGAALIPVTLTCPGRRQHLDVMFHPQISDPGVGSDAERVARMTQEMADAFARAVAASPTDWHMLARLWQDDLDPERAIGTAARAPAVGRSDPARTV